MRVVSFGLLAILLGTGSAFAAGAYEPLTAGEMVDWSGAHLGANVGWGTGQVTGTYSGPSIPTSTVVPFSTSGAIGGLQAGYDFQVNHMVFGVEADVDMANITGSGVQYNSGGTVVTATTKINWVATLRGRAGFAFDRFLIYGTGGVVSANNTLTLVSTGGFTGTATNSQTHSGWVLGFGADYSLTKQWSIGAEYKHLYLGSATYTDPTNIPNSKAILNLSNDIFTLRANYHF